MSGFKFELARSSDLSRIGELTQARGRNLVVTLNKAGALDFSLPLRHEEAMAAIPVATCVIVALDDQDVWSGPVWTARKRVDAQGASLQIGCVGWLHTLEKRVVRPTWNAGQHVTYTDKDAGFIALDLLGRSNQDAFTAGAPSYVVPGTYEITQNRTRSYAPHSGVLEAIEEMSTVESGYDLAVDPSTRELNIYEQLRTDTDVHYDLSTNASSFEESVDAGRMVNYMTAYSSYAAPAVTDSFSCAEYGLFEESRALSDVPNASILAAYAAAELAVLSRPPSSISFDPMPPSDDNPLMMPVPFRDFQPGDVVYASANDGALQIKKQPTRIFSFSVGESDNGTFGKVGNVQGTAT